MAGAIGGDPKSSAGTPPSGPWRRRSPPARWPPPLPLPAAPAARPLPPACAAAAPALCKAMSRRPFRRRPRSAKEARSCACSTATTHIWNFLCCEVYQPCSAPVDGGLEALGLVVLFGAHRSRLRLPQGRHLRTLSWQDEVTGSAAQDVLSSGGTLQPSGIQEPLHIQS